MKNYEELEEEREEVAYFMRRLYRQGLTTCSGGNLSLRVDGGQVLLTPSALDKGELRADQIGLFTADGKNLTPHLKSSIETEMHLSILRARPDVQAVVHAHPVTATSFAAMDMDINCALTAEAYAVLGTVARSSYALMGTDGLAKLVSEALRNADVSVMQNHGVIAVGNTMLKAFDRLEVLENAARMTWITETLRCARSLSKDQKTEIEKNFWP